ncbi:MAG: branched-chain amino acid ABC transporter permease [Oscillatoriales cyanobacterium SM2_2_1]|nr:branched-chain amino acid ABC transporter permease [Oscillatoriales cyanobacterium SM2_2_1]
MDWVVALLQAGVDGLAFGSVIALGAIGLTLSYGILRLANFAHGDLLTVGAYLTLAANGGLNWPLPLAAAMGVLGTMAVTLICDALLWAPLRSRRATPTTLMIASIGLALVLRNGLILIWGVSPQRFDLSVSPAIALGDLVLITSSRLWAMAIALVAVAAVYLLLQKTKIGRAMRAVADSPELSRISGIPVAMVTIITWLVTGALAALSGELLGLITTIRPNMGWLLILPIFAATILGGIGNPYGAIAGALIVGVAQEVSTVCPASLGSLAQYCLSTDYKLGVGLLIMILVLLFRPRGLFRGTQG